MNKQFVDYGRVSTERQESEGLSLTAQHERCVEYAQRNSWDIVKTFAGAESAFDDRSAQRPKFNAMLRYVRDPKKHICGILVATDDRWARDLRHSLDILEELAELGIEVYAVDSGLLDPDDIGTIVRGWSNRKSSMKNSQATTRSMLKAARQGKPMSQPPVGYICVRRSGATYWEHELNQAQLVRECFELYATGLYSQRQVCRTMTAKGLRSKHGKAMNAAAFDRMLKNPAYAGHLEWQVLSTKHKDKSLIGEKAEDVDAAAAGFVKPIISVDLFIKVQGVLQDRARNLVAEESRVNGAVWPLKRFVKCGKCNHPFTAGFVRGKMRKRYAYYFCAGHSVKDGHVSVRSNVLESMFQELLRTVTPTPEAIERVRQTVREKATCDASVTAKKCADLKSRKAKLESRIEVLHDHLADGIVRKEDFVRKRDAYQEQIGTLESEITTLESIGRNAKSVDMLLARAEGFLVNLCETYAEADFDDRTAIQRLIWPNGIAFDGKKFFKLSMSPLFKALQRIETEKSKMASPTRFELVSSP